MALVINDMIFEASGRRKEILLRLKKLNRLAYQEYMMAPAYRYGKTFKQKYSALQKSDIWSEAKRLLIEYFTVDGQVRCSLCGRELRSVVIHHDTYNDMELFTPEYIRPLSSKCHSRVHKRY